MAQKSRKRGDYKANRLFQQATANVVVTACIMVLPVRPPTNSLPWSRLYVPLIGSPEHAFSNTTCTAASGRMLGRTGRAGGSLPAHHSGRRGRVLRRGCVWRYQCRGNRGRGSKTSGQIGHCDQPEKHLGGLSSGGLGFTDTGNKAAIGGLSREFYHRVWKHYDEDKAWTWQTRGSYGNKGQGTPAIDGSQRTQWIFEPHVAEAVFEDFVKEHDIKVVRNQWLDRTPGRGVVLDGKRIGQIRTESGLVVKGKMFIDATYEGDLMAVAGVPYAVGREANAEYQETWNGIQVGTLHHKHWFKNPVDPYVKPGDPASGLLPRISADPPGIKGEADKRIQAYCYRMCLTQHEPNRIPFPNLMGTTPGSMNCFCASMTRAGARPLKSTIRFQT